MERLPKDPIMLYSVINTKLRDFYSSLEALCEDMNIDENTLKEKLSSAKRVIINGPMGCFENPNYQEGTKEIYQYLTDNHIKTLVGGGDSAASVNQLSDPQKFYHISTGGGATLEYLEGTILPGISVIDEK